jgi:hypothetical protein
MAIGTSKKETVTPTPTNGLTKLLALEYDGDHRRFTFALDGDCFKTDNLLRSVLEKDFLPQLNREEKLRYALMEMTTYVTFSTPYRQAIPEIFRAVLDKPLNKPTEDSDSFKSLDNPTKYSEDPDPLSGRYLLHWQIPLHDVFNFLCHNDEREKQLFPEFETEINNILTSRHPHPMNIDAQTVEDVNRVVITAQTPHQLLNKLNQGEVDPRTMLIVNAAMRAYGYVFGRTIDS